MIITLWARVRIRSSRCWVGSDRAVRAEPRRRLCREMPLSAWVRWRYCRTGNRSNIIRRYRPVGGPAWFRGLIGMAVLRMPRTRRHRAWLCSASYPLSATTRRGRRLVAAWQMAGTKSGESWLGPRAGTAPTIRWEAVWNTAVNLGQAAWVDAVRPTRRRKWADAWRVSNPVESTAAVAS